MAEQFELSPEAKSDLEDVVIVHARACTAQSLRMTQKFQDATVQCLKAAAAISTEYADTVLECIEEMAVKKEDGVDVCSLCGDRKAPPIKHHPTCPIRKLKELQSADH